MTYERRNEYSIINNRGAVYRSGLVLKTLFTLQNLTDFQFNWYIAPITCTRVCKHIFDSAFRDRNKVNSEKCEKLVLLHLRAEIDAILISEFGRTNPENASYRHFISVR